MPGRRDIKRDNAKDRRERHQIELPRDRIRTAGVAGIPQSGPKETKTNGLG